MYEQARTSGGSCGSHSLTTTVDARACRPSILDPVRPDRTGRGCLPHSPNSSTTSARSPVRPARSGPARPPAPGGSHTASSGARHAGSPRHQPHHRHDRLARRRPTASLHRRADGPGRGRGQLRRAWTSDRIPRRAGASCARAGSLRPARRRPATARWLPPPSPPGRLPAARSATPATPPWRTLGPTPWRASYCCNHCRQPFEQFKTGSTGRLSIPGGTGQTPSGAGGRDADAGGAPSSEGPSCRR
jgi:hypothetical protein